MGYRTHPHPYQTLSHCLEDHVGRLIYKPSATRETPKVIPSVVESLSLVFSGLTCREPPFMTELSVQALHCKV